VEPYRINPGDVLKLFVWNEESLGGEVIVRPDGVVSFPMAGQIQAGGNTTTEVEQLIVAGLARYLKGEPVVTVSLVRLDGNIIYVLGKVNRPGAFPVISSVDVTQALSLAGGLNAFADENSIKVLRRDKNGEQQALPFNYSAIKSGKKLESNIILKSGDVVVVP
jgi:polysaccharide export outer membrane protein